MIAAERLVVLSGAGLSAESGISTFRGAGGHWREHRATDLATPEAFERDPALVWEWYSDRRRAAQDALPNPAHHALASLQEEWGRDRVALVT
ncbi:MAG: NAD-dependent protein deacylase, partial [Planctomycetes bacterium]|nr:NAD-dependent protein deacylase [Planctomycetota bacterium]